MIELRGYQNEFVDKIAAAYARRNRAVLAVSPCGSGKTPSIAVMAHRAALKGRRVLVTVPRIDLITQTARTFASMGIELGGQIKLTTLQSARLRLLDADFIINDEGHWGLSTAWEDLLKGALLSGARVLGFTASPIPGMDRVYSDMVMGPSVSWLMGERFLSDYVPYGPSQPDLSKVPVYGGEYAKGASAEVMAKPSITGDMIEHWLKLAPGKRTIAYEVSREASRDRAAAFVAAGIPAEHLDGDTPSDIRRDMFARFARRETRILFNVEVFQLGLDLSSQVGEDVPIEAMIDGQPRKSVPSQVQKWGRVQRWKSEPAVILDHANNFRDLQLFPDTEMDWSIETGVRRKSDLSFAVSICSTCLAAFKTVPACPYCQTVRKLTPREIEEREGELREIERQKNAKARRIEVGRADGLDALARIAVEREYAVGWVKKRAEIKGMKVSWPQVEDAMRRAREVGQAYERARV